MRRSGRTGILLALAMGGGAAAWTACGGDDGGTTGPTGSGSVSATLTMSGASQDVDGCVVSLDGGGQRRIMGGETATWSGVAVGPHDVGISDVAGNCQVVGDLTRSVSVAERQTTTVTFAVTCDQSVGSIEVTTQTGGEDLDPDGYGFSVDGAGSIAIGVNATARTGGLAPGDHTVALQGVASNCSVGGGSTRSVPVVENQTTSVTFPVNCVALAGSIDVSATTAGEDLDEDGYEIRIDGGAPSLIGINGSFLAGGLSPGDHEVELSGEAFNCAVNGENPRTVTVSADAATPVAFDVTCRYHLYDRIAFESNRTGISRLYAVDPGAPGTVRSLDLQGSEPAVSPDGLRIAYRYGYDIWVARSDGSGAVRITDTPAAETSPAWSPDGTRIAFERDGEIWTMREDGSDASSLGATGTRPSWSPDGTRIAWEYQDPNQNDMGHLWVMNADGSDQELLEAYAYHPAWSPLGNLIAFDDIRAGPSHVFVVESVGGPAVNMTVGLVDNASQATWAPDAAAGAFVSSSGNADNSDIFTFVPGSPAAVQLTTSPARDWNPSWGGGN